MELLRQEIEQEKQKKKALMQQQLGGFFHTELTKAFGPEPEPATLPIDRAYLKAVKLSAVDFTECTVTDFHEGEHKGLRFSAANVELRRTVEEKSGPDNDNWMTRTETLFRGIVVRCKDICDPALDIALLAAEGDFSALPEMTLAADDSLTIGRKVYVAGYPYGMPFTITEGSVSSPKQLMDGKYYIQTDAAVNPGNSGGPILNDAKEVVGVTVSKFTQADNMGFGIRVETLHALLDTIGDLDRTVFQVQCGSCEELIAQEEEYCPSCGDKLPEGVFEEREQSPLGGFVESAIEQMGVNPVLARDGYDSWLFHKGSSEIRIFVYDNSYLFSTSPINLLPKKEVEPVLDYMLSEDFGPYKLGIEGRQIYIAYRIHLSDITDESEEEIRKNIVDLALRADAMDNMLVERFGCEFSEYSKADAQ